MSNYVQKGQNGGHVYLITKDLLKFWQCLINNAWLLTKYLKKSILMVDYVHMYKILQLNAEIWQIMYMCMSN